MTDEAESWAAGLMRRAVALGESIARACERHQLWLLAACSVLYAVVIAMIAVRKELENDELFTLYIAQLPSMSDVWAALMGGGEQLPPFFYVLTRASLSAFGDTSFAVRLPAIVGLWVMCLCLFIFVSRRSSVLHAVVAIFLALSTNAYNYAFEARPYGIVLGLCGVALVCWQSLAEGTRWRLVALFGLAASLGAAFACHYYAVLALIPFACGEAARTISRRRVDVPVWAALAASLVPLLLFLPLINAARGYSAAFWSQPSWGDIPGFYAFLLLSGAMPLGIALSLVGLYFAVLPESNRASDRARVATRASGLHSQEIAAVMGFLAVPFVAVAIGMFVTHAYTNRYSLPATFGLVILMAFGLHRALRGHDALTLLLALCLVAGFARRGRMTLEASAQYVQTREGAISMLLKEPADMPVVCSDPRLFIILSYYAPPELRSRLVYLADPAQSLYYLGHNSVDRGTLDLLKPWFRLNVQPYRPYLDSHGQFLLVGDPQNFLNWTLRDFVESRAQVDLIGLHQEILVFRVSPKRSAL